MATIIRSDQMNSSCLRILFPFAMGFIFAGCASRDQRATLPEQSVASASHAMVVSDAPLATRTGVSLLLKGGNAVDAAVGTALALAVVYPEAGNLGGGGYMVARLADGSSAALDFREAAPAAATRNMYLDSTGNVTEDASTGHRASGVPGSVAGLWEAHRRYGRLAWKDVVSPALRLAEEGFSVDKRLARTLRADSARLSHFEGSRKLFFPNGHPLREGSDWQNPDLAATLRRIAEKGADGFYRGETAELIVREMRRGGGLLKADDLAAYRAVWRTPLEFRYRGRRVISTPPSSSGGATLATIAEILEGYNLRSMGFQSPDAILLTAEAMRRAFSDRNEFLGDPDFIHLSLDSLLSPTRMAMWRSTINPKRATPSFRIANGTLIPLPEGMETTHLSVADAEGNVVALTTTINDLYGCAVTVEGAGFLLNNEMDDFTTRPGWPNGFGLVQGESNIIAPRKRMLSSMTPTIVCDSLGQVELVTGARGGPFIITAVFQVLSNVVDYGMDLPTAVTAPRIHHQHYPDHLRYEGGALTPATAEELTRRGYELEVASGLGSTCSILRSNGVWIGVADPRSGGRAEGY